MLILLLFPRRMGQNQNRIVRKKNQLVKREYLNRHYSERIQKSLNWSQARISFQSKKRYFLRNRLVIFLRFIRIWYFRILIIIRCFEFWNVSVTSSTYRKHYWWVLYIKRRNNLRNCNYVLKVWVDKSLRMSSACENAMQYKM